MSEQEKTFGQIFVDALIYFLYTIVYILFICPFEFWKKATVRLCENRQSESIRVTKTQSRWPFFSFIKKIFFEFFVDGTIFISYPIGLIVAIVSLFTDAGFAGFVGVIVAVYYFPLGMSLFRDLVVWALLPLQKFLSWCAKPAQQLDLDFHNHTPENK